MGIAKYQIPIVTNASGAATEVLNFGFNSALARLVRVKVDYASDFTATGTLVIADADQTLLTKASTATDQDAYLSAPVVNNVGTAATNGYSAPIVKGPITVTVTGGGNTKVVTVYLWLEQ